MIPISVLGNSWPLLGLLQTNQTPIWVPLLIILLIVLLFWWGLTRNKVSRPIEPEESAEDTHLMLAEEEHEPLVADEDWEAPPVAAEPMAIAATEEVLPAEPLLEEPAPVHMETSAERSIMAETILAHEPDDLRRIEGIGPKIAGILAQAGITTFAELANTEVDRLERIVQMDAGIRIADPSSWPEQAELAAAGRWEALQELQDRLTAGRHK